MAAEEGVSVLRQGIMGIRTILPSALEGYIWDLRILGLWESVTLKEVDLGWGFLEEVAHRGTVPKVRCP